MGRPLPKAAGMGKQVVEARAFGTVIDHHVRLARKNQNPDPGQHSIDDCG